MLLCYCRPLTVFTVALLFPLFLHANGELSPCPSPGGGGQGGGEVPRCSFQTVDGEDWATCCEPVVKNEVEQTGKTDKVTCDGFALDLPEEFTGELMTVAYPELFCVDFPIGRTRSCIAGALDLCLEFY